MPSINHAAKPPETCTAPWHCIARCGTPGEPARARSADRIHRRAREDPGAATSCRPGSGLPTKASPYTQRAELWRIVDYREWCLKMLVQDFPAELERIDREIERRTAALISPQFGVARQCAANRSCA